MSKKQKYLSVKVGDIVLIDLVHYHDAHMRNFEAKVTAVRDRLSTAPLISYERLDGFKEDRPVGAGQLCDVGFVKQVVVPAPYICVPRQRVNIFTGDERHTNRSGGLRSGHISSLVIEALASVRHIDLLYSLHEDRVEELYERACWPGRVASSDPDRYCWGWNTVRWKTFHRWVHANAARLIESKAEAIASDRAFQKRMDDDLMRKLEDDMDLLDDERYDDLSLEDQMLMEGDEYYEDDHWTD